MTRDTHAKELPFPPEWLTAALSRLESLTGRQRTILLLLGLGMDNSMIAQELACTERTVKQHITAIFARLGVDSRLQAGLVAYHDRLQGDNAWACPAEPPNSIQGKAE